MDKGKDFLGSIPQGTRQILDQDIRPAIENAKELLSSNKRQPQLEGASVNGSVNTPSTSPTKSTQPQQHKIEGDMEDVDAPKPKTETPVFRGTTEGYRK